MSDVATGVKPMSALEITKTIFEDKTTEVNTTIKEASTFYQRNLSSINQ